MTVTAAPERATGGGTPVIRQATEARSRRIESIRALAAIGVVQYHTMLLAVIGRHPYSHFEATVASWGIAPIYVFFALSGYLIFRPFARRDYGAGGPVNLRSYALNRVVRLLPIYYIAVVLLLIVDRASGDDWWHYLLFAQTYSVKTLYSVDQPLWTLIIELQFYLALPLVAWVVARASGGSAARAIGLLLVIAAASYAFHLGVRNVAAHPVAHWTFPANFVFLLSGMILGVLETRWRALRVDRLPAWLTSSGVWFLAGVALWPLTQNRSLPADGVALVASFLIVGAVVLPLRPSRAVSWLDWPPLATLGIATYSLYVWHYPLLKGLVKIGVLRFSFPLDAVLAIAISATVGLISYRVIEARFLRLRRRWAPTTVEATLGAPAPATGPASPSRP